MSKYEDTIYAESTSHGRAGVSVIRVSGPTAIESVSPLVSSIPRARYAGVRWLIDPTSKTRIDEALILVFPGPNSFTGEDVVEIQSHGSRAVVRSIQKYLGSIAGNRLAEPGEFTRRALMNGRLDLVQTEGLSDLLAAETELQHRQAMETMSGAMSKRAMGWRSELVDILARIEVTIDFADEELPDDVLKPLAARLDKVQSDMTAAISGAAISERIREGFRVAVVGRPNVGKSTLLNALAGRDAAITSDVEGTTRDIIEVQMDIGGIPVTLMDMAGLRTSTDKIESLGVERARAAALKADLRLFLLTSPEDLSELNVEIQTGDIVAVAKGDLNPIRDQLTVSGKTGLGLDELMRQLGSSLEDRILHAGPVSHQRQIVPIGQAALSIETASRYLSQTVHMEEQTSMEIRTALRALEFLIGHVDVEHVLDNIFSSFCLGK